MPDINPACKTDPFPDWPFGVNPDDPREPLKPGTDVRVPLKVRACPHCGARLIAEIREWFEDEDGLMQVDTVRLHCTDEPDEIEDEYETWFQQHYMRPYERWPGAELAVERWLNETYQMIGYDSPRYA